MKSWSSNEFFSATLTKRTDLMQFTKPTIIECNVARPQRRLVVHQLVHAGAAGRVKGVGSIGFRALIGLGVISAQFMAVGGATANATQGKTTLALAEKALLVKSDFPKSWTSTKSSNNNSSFPGAAQLARCIGVPESVVTSNPPTAYSPEFDSSNHLLSVDDSVSIYPSAKGRKR